MCRKEGARLVYTLLFFFSSIARTHLLFFDIFLFQRILARKPHSISYDPSPYTIYGCRHRHLGLLPSCLVRFCCKVSIKQLRIRRSSRRVKCLCETTTRTLLNTGNISMSMHLYTLEKSRWFSCERERESVSLCVFSCGACVHWQLNMGWTKDAIL